MQGGLLPYFIECNINSIWHGIQITIFSTFMIQKYVQTTKCLVKIIKGLIQVIKMYSLDFHDPKYSIYSYKKSCMPDLTTLSLKGTVIWNLQYYICFHKEFSQWMTKFLMKMLKMLANLYEFRDMIHTLYLLYQESVAV